MERKKQNKEDLEDKIQELEEKLELLNRELYPDTKHNMIVGTSPIGFNELDTLREIAKAKRESEQKAGLIKTTDDGSVWEEDDVVIDKIPTTSIHVFENMNKCECKCHDKNKHDCMNCYDHPEHLESKRKKPLPKDEPKKEKVPFWKR